MRTMKIKGELVELPETLPNHPYFRSQAWSRKRNRAIYGMYVSEERMTFKQVGEFWGISGGRAQHIVAKIASVIQHLEAGNPYYGCVASRD